MVTPKTNIRQRSSPPNSLTGGTPPSKLMPPSTGNARLSVRQQSSHATPQQSQLTPASQQPVNTPQKRLLTSTAAASSEHLTMQQQQHFDKYSAQLQLLQAQNDLLTLDLHAAEQKASAFAAETATLKSKLAATALSDNNRTVDNQQDMLSAANQRIIESLLAEKHQWNEERLLIEQNIAEFEKMCAGLVSERERWATEREHLQRRLHDYQSELQEALQKERQSWVQEKENLIAESIRGLQERDALINRLEAYVAEKEAAASTTDTVDLQQINRLTKALSDCQNELTDTKAELSQLRKDYEQLKADAAATQHKEEAKAAADRLAACQSQEMQERLAKLQQRLDGKENECESAKAQLTQQSRQLEAALAEHQSALDEVVGVRQLLNEHRKQYQDLAKEFQRSQLAVKIARNELEVLQAAKAKEISDLVAEFDRQQQQQQDRMKLEAAKSLPLAEVSTCTISVQTVAGEERAAKSIQAGASHLQPLADKSTETQATVVLLDNLDLPSPKAPKDLPPLPPATSPLAASSLAPIPVVSCYICDTEGDHSADTCPFVKQQQWCDICASFGHDTANCERIDETF